MGKKPYHMQMSMIGASFLKAIMKFHTYHMLMFRADVKE
jgi:hypothetical protein